MVLKNNGVNIESTNEVLEYNNGMLMCVYESERKWKESVEGEWLQRVNFPQVYCEPRCLQMLLWKGKSPLLLEDMRSLSCSPKFYELVPSVWDGRESVIWCYSERDLDRELCIDREIELFQLKRNYKELKERLELKEIDDIQYLPCKIEMDNYFDDVIDIVEYNEKITYLVLTRITDGDRTKSTNVDRFYELIGDNGVKYYVDNGHNNNNNKLKVHKNNLCFKYVRYLHDDGG